MEIQNIIYSLDSNKSGELDSISTSVSKLLENDISNTLADIIKICIFPTIFKVVKVFLHDNSKLDFSNHHPISLVTNIEKNIEEIRSFVG